MTIAHSTLSENISKTITYSAFQFPNNLIQYKVIFIIIIKNQLKIIKIVKKKNRFFFFRWNVKFWD